MKTTFASATVGLATICMLALAGCNKDNSQQGAGPEPGSGRAATGSAQPAPVSAVKNSFQETTSHLDPGGNLYVYLSTEHFLEGLSGKIAEWRQIVDEVPNLGASEQEVAGKAFDIVTNLVKDSGLEEVSGVGLSSIAVEKGMYRNKLFIHHYPGKGKGFLWSLGGKKAHALTELDMLPANTAVAVSSDFDIPGLWLMVREQVAKSGFPEAQQFLEGLPTQFEQATGLKWDAVLASLGGEFGVALTLDESNKVAIPLPTSQTLQIPAVGLMLMAKVNDDTIFKRVAGLMEAQGGDAVVRVDTPDLKMRTLPVPLPLPIQLRPSVAASAGYLLIASSDALIQEAVAVKAGQKPGLKTQEEFKHLAKDIPMQGNGFSFVSQRFTRAMLAIQGQALENAPQAGPGRALIPLLQAQKAGSGFSVNVNTPEGWLSVGNASQSEAKTLVAGAVVVPAAIGAAMVLPALAKAKVKAQTIGCMNNMKQLGIATKIWELDNNDVLPQEFLSLTNELGTPKVLFCPQDKERHAAADWASFNAAENCSYEFLAPGATNADSEPLRVIFRCKVDGNVALADGSVQAARKTGSPLAEHDGKLYWENGQ